MQVKSNDADTLLKIVEMGGKYHPLTAERDWLYRLLKAIDERGKLGDFAKKWIPIIASTLSDTAGSNYFQYRNDIRDDAYNLVREIAGSSYDALIAKEKSLKEQLKQVQNTLGRFNAWSPSKLRI